MIQRFLEAVYNLFSLGGTTGGLIVRQKGGTAGTHDVQISHNGTNGIVSTLAGSLNITGATGAIRTADGNATAPGHSFITRPDSGHYVLNNYDVGISAGSTKVGRWDGNLGGLIIGSSGENYQVKFSATDGEGTPDCGIRRLAIGVLKPTDGTTGSGWIQNSAGRSVLTADVPNDSAALATTGLSVTVKAGRKYSFLAYLFVTTGAVLEGIQAGLAGTSTITNLIADVEIKSHAATPVFSMGRVTAYGTAIGQTVADAGNATVEISGTLECNAAGTLRIDFAKNADTGAANTIVRRGSYLLVEDMP